MDDEWTNEWMDERVNRGMDREMNEWMKERMDEWMKEWMDELSWMKKMVNEFAFIVVSKCEIWLWSGESHKLN